MSAHAWVRVKGQQAEWSCSRCRLVQFISTAWSADGDLRWEWPRPSAHLEVWSDEQFTVRPECLGDRIEALFPAQAETMQTLWRDGWSWPDALTAAERL